MSPCAPPDATEDIEFSFGVTIKSRAGVPHYTLAQAEYDAITPLPVRLSATVGVESEVNVDG